MNKFYKAIEEKIKASGYPREISGRGVYNDICDQIEDKENGLLVNAKDVRQLSDAMNMLIEDENLRKELEVNAKKRYVEEFSFDKLAKEYRDYYGRL